MAHAKVTRAYDAIHGGVANTYTYSGSFDTFKATEVVVELDNVALTYQPSTINEAASPREYTVDYANKTIHIGGGNLSSGSVVIKPVTDLGAPKARAEYSPGSSITSEDLNNNQLQLLRRAMEYEEQVMFKTGGTMTGTLEMGEDQVIKFEGATADGYETTVTVTDPTADRTITLPNVTGTVITTGDTATVTATMMAANSVDSSELVDGSVDLSHMSVNSIDSDQYVDGSIDSAHLADDSVNVHKLGPDAVTGASIQDNSIDSEHYVDGSIDSAHIANDQIDSQHYAAGSIDLEHMSSASVDSDNIVNDTIVNADINSSAAIAHSKLANLTSAQVLVGNGSNVPTGVAISGDVTLANTGAVTIASGAVETGMIADDAVDADKLAANAVVTGSIADGAILNADINASAAIAHSKLANVTDGQILVGNGSNVPTAVAVSGDATIANTGAVTIAGGAVEMSMLHSDLKQSSVADSASQIPTSAAVVSYVAAQIAPIGGLEVIADDESFPNTIPAAGVVISITDAAGLSVNSSGVSTNGDALDNSTITINGFPSELRGGVNGNADPYVFASGAGLMVQSTGSSQTYNYHQAMIREADFVQLSDDINDFNSRYRIGTKTADNASSNDDGDLFFDTGTNKMYVYDGAYNSGGSWKEVTSAGDFKILTVKDNGEAVGGAGPTFNSSITQYDLFDGNADASITNAQQLIVVLNGVIQKPNSGSWDTNEEGFYLDGSDGIRFCDGPPANSTLFVTQIGTATTIGTPGSGSINAANMFAAGVINAAAIGTGAVEHAKLGADCVDGDNIQDDVINSEHYAAGSIDGEHIANDQIDSQHYAAGSIDLEHMSSESVDEDNLHISNAGTDGQFLSKQAGNNGGLTWATVSASDGTKMPLAGGTFTGDVIWDNGTNAGNDMTWDESDNALEFTDNTKATFGTGGDMSVYHNGSNSNIDHNASAAGDLFIRNRSTTGNGNVYIESGNGVNGESENAIVCQGNGKVKLYYSGTERLETFTDGTSHGGVIIHGPDSDVTDTWVNVLDVKATSTGTTTLWASASAPGFTTRIRIFGENTNGGTGAYGWIGSGYNSGGDADLRLGADGYEHFVIGRRGTLHATSDGSHAGYSSGHSGTTHEIDNARDSADGTAITSSNASMYQACLYTSCARSSSDTWEVMRAYSSGDQEFELEGDGDAYADGSWSGGGADYAEFFEWQDGNPSNEDRRGMSVTLVGNKIKLASSGDTIIGIVSRNPVVIGDAAWNKWTGKHLTDDWGEYIREDHKVVKWTDLDDEGNPKTGDKDHVYTYEDWNIPSDVTVPSHATYHTHDGDGNKFNHRKLNPEWDENLTYVDRKHRKEWETIGLVGKLRLKKGQPTDSRWIKMRDISSSVEEWLVR